jgi:hypothetical protein
MYLGAEDRSYRPGLFLHGFIFDIIDIGIVRVNRKLTTGENEMKAITHLLDCRCKGTVQTAKLFTPSTV